MSQESFSFFRYGEAIAGSEIALMDIDPSRLPMMERLGRRIVMEKGVDLKITSTVNLKESLGSSTFVLTNFRPGGIEGLRLDEEIPVKYGILGQETSGPGGTFFALRSIPQVLSLCESMEAMCPDAWLINYTNPTNFVADAVHRESKIKCAAICDGGGNGLNYWLSEALNLKLGEVRARCAGTNHPTNWLIELQVKGEDGYPLLRKHVKEHLQKNVGEERKHDEFVDKIMEIYGLYPSNPGYLYPYFNHDNALARHKAGFLIAIILGVLHARYIWFPFEPIGFFIATEEWELLAGLWTTFLVAWIAKFLTLRIGGSKAYENYGVPLASGFVMGFTIIGLIGGAILILRFFVPF